MSFFRIAASDFVELLRGAATFGGVRRGVRLSGAPAPNFSRAAASRTLQKTCVFFKKPLDNHKSLVV